MFSASNKSELHEPGLTASHLNAGLEYKQSDVAKTTFKALLYVIDNKKFVFI